jgi:mannosyl-oligosaccharide glucosidase
MVPSRSFFPRGFLWDEGFHLLVVIKWDLDLALEILQSWFALMDEDGWIGREQILGPEARSKVPEEFQTQYRDYANPPTLFFIVEAFLDMASGKTAYHGAKSRHLEPGAARMFLTKLFPKLKLHYDWWIRSQKGEVDYIDEEKHIHHGFRWRGQTTTHLLTCGLDDYPRSNPAHPQDLHVDALSWVSLMAGVLAKVADYLGGTYSLEAFAQQKENFDRGLEFLHWSEEDQVYCDTTNREELWVYECHKGYISILPFLLGSLNATHPHLNAILNLMRDEKDLWTPFGLRSLSRSDKIYGTEENYWRGPIWININYLAIIKLFVSTPHPNHRI